MALLLPLLALRCPAAHSSHAALDAAPGGPQALDEHRNNGDDPWCEERAHNTKGGDVIWRVLPRAKENHRDEGGDAEEGGDDRRRDKAIRKLDTLAWGVVAAVAEDAARDAANQGAGEEDGEGDPSWDEDGTPRPVRSKDTVQLERDDEELRKQKAKPNVAPLATVLAPSAMLLISGLALAD